MRQIFLIIRKKGKPEFLLIPSGNTNKVGELMAQQEKYKSDLYSSIEKIPDEILPYLGELVYDKSN